MVIKHTTFHERNLANHAIKREYYHPATNSFPGTTACRTSWSGNPYVGSFKNHCFYQSDPKVCHSIH